MRFHRYFGSRFSAMIVRSAIVNGSKSIIQTYTLNSINNYTKTKTTRRTSAAGRSRMYSPRGELNEVDVTIYRNLNRGSRTTTKKYTRNEWRKTLEKEKGYIYIYAVQGRPKKHTSLKTAIKSVQISIKLSFKKSTFELVSVSEKQRTCDAPYIPLTSTSKLLL